MEAEAVEKILASAFPDAKVEAEDFTGGGDHFNVCVVSTAFEGKTLIEQHKLVHQSLAAAFSDGSIHAVHIKTETPASLKKKQDRGGDLNVLT